jgi:hypothetical protein
MTRLPVCLSRLKAVRPNLRSVKHRSYADPSNSVPVTRLEAVKRRHPPRQPTRLPLSGSTAPTHYDPSTSMPIPPKSRQPGSPPRLPPKPHIIRLPVSMPRLEAVKLGVSTPSNPETAYIPYILVCL